MDAIPEATASLRSGRKYEIYPSPRREGWLVVVDVEEPAVVIDLTGRAWAAGRDWAWAVTKEHLAWRLVVESAGKEVLRVAPRGEVVKYRMAADGRLVCKLRQNLFTRRWSLYHGMDVLARIEVNPLFFSVVADASSTPPLAGYLELGKRLPSDSVRSACVICALLCIRFDAGYANASVADGSGAIGF